MSEQRLRELLTGAAADPGAKQEWPAFLKTARRHRLIHRARIAGGVALLIVVVTAAGALLEEVPDRERPRPAEKEEERRERESRRGEVAELEERIRESQELVEDAGLVPGPPPDTLEGHRRTVRRSGGGRGPVAIADPRSDATVDEDPATVLCRGKAATVVGTPGRDVLEGTPGFDVIAGLGGDDTIRGNGGGDYLCGGDGIDHLFGDAGDDSLVGGLGDDALDGGPGYDFLHFPAATQGVQVFFDDRMSYGDGEDLVRDVEAAEGTPFSDSFVGDAAANLFWGDEGVDFFDGGGGGDYIWPGAGDDRVEGQAGSDTIGFHFQGGSSARGVDVDLAAGRAFGEGVDTIAGVENVYGTTGNDVISGSGASNALNGGFGDDTITGAGGDDVLTGAHDNDTLDGGSGHDTLDGGAGEDACTTGEETTGCETTDPISQGRGPKVGADGDPAPLRAAAALTSPAPAVPLAYAVAGSPNAPWSIRSALRCSWQTRLSVTPISRPISFSCLRS